MAYDKDKARKKAIENENKAKELLKNVRESYRDNPETLAEVFAFASNFYTYSPKNTQLIFAQNPYVTFCQSFKAWKDMDAPVRPGEHGYKIWVPVRTTLLKVGDKEFVKLSEATDQQKKAYKNGKIEGYIKNHYAIGTVFDISQTTFPVDRYPEIYSMGYSSEEHAMIYQGIKDFSDKELGCLVIEENLESIALRGVYRPKVKTISINQLLKDTGKLSVGLHELGHALMDHLGGGETAQKEVEADAVGIMLQTSFGIPVDETRKRHFLNHYKIMEKEICEKFKESITASVELEKTIDRVFDNVYDIYRNNIDKIQEYVSHYLPQDQHLKNERYRNNNLQDKSMEDENSMQRALRRRAAEIGRHQASRRKGIEI